MLARERALEMALAEAARHVHEAGGANTGPRVKQYQGATGLAGTGRPWCDAFCDFCFEEAGRSLDELERSAGVEHTFELAKSKGWLVNDPARADLVCFQWDSGPLDHIGFVVQPMPDGSVKTVEGNTSPMAGVGHAQGEGGGVYVKIRPAPCAPHSSACRETSLTRSSRPATTSGRDGSRKDGKALGRTYRSRFPERGGRN